MQHVRPVYFGKKSKCSSKSKSFQIKEIQRVKWITNCGFTVNSNSFYWYKNILEAVVLSFKQSSWNIHGTYFGGSQVCIRLHFRDVEKREIDSVVFPRSSKLLKLTYSQTRALYNEVIDGDCWAVLLAHSKPSELCYYAVNSDKGRKNSSWSGWKTSTTQTFSILSVGLGDLSNLKLLKSVFSESFMIYLP